MSATYFLEGTHRQELQQKKEAIDERENNFCKKYIKEDEQKESKEYFETEIHFCENFFKTTRSLFIIQNIYIIH